jgi:hypothetical protein
MTDELFNENEIQTAAVEALKDAVKEIQVENKK